ncbi:MAG: COG1361 family protein [Minisyncoccota bacterium]
MQNDKKSALEELNEKMYKPGFRRAPLESGVGIRHAPNVPDDWGAASFHDDDFGATSSQSVMKKTHHLAKWFLYGGIAFFVIAAGFAAYTIFFGSGLSSKDVSITLEGPGTASGGTAFSFDVVIRNKNISDIEASTLVLHLPDGVSLVTQDGKTQVGTVTQSIDTIPSSGIARKTFRIVAYGAEGTQVAIPLSLDFRFRGQSATWQSKANYSFTITSSPVNLTITSTKEISSGQQFDLAINVGSNTDKGLDGMMVRVDYPSGFQFTGASLDPVYGNNVWRLGTLTAGTSTTIQVHGVMQGNDGEQKIFSIGAGQKSDTDPTAIGTIYNTTTQTVSITKPFISVGMSIDGHETSDTVATVAGRTIRVDLGWKNSTASKIVDAEVDVKLSGAALDRYSVNTGGQGFYRSGDDTIVWTKQDVDQLAVLEPGDHGTVGFSLRTFSLDGGMGKNLHNPTVTLSVSVSGKRISESNVPQAITMFVVKTIRVDTNLNLATRAIYYGTTPFQNSGPMPPRPEKETVYTVIWTVTNGANDASGVVAKMTLPVYARFLGTVSPATEDLKNPVGSDIVWNLGTARAGTGVGGPPREVAFQVGITPSIAQIGQVINITGSTSLVGTDAFTGTALSAITQRLTTRLSSDPGFKDTDSFVTQ